MSQAFFHDIIRHSYGPLVKALPLTHADRSYRPEVPTMTDTPNQIHLSSEDVRGVVDVSTPASRQHIGEGGPPPRDGANGNPLKRVTDGPPASSPSLLEKLVYAEVHVDFRHPAAVRKQRDIWLPKDPFGLVREIEQDLDSQGILHSTACAKIYANGHVDVIQDALALDVPTVEFVEGEGDDADAILPLLSYQ